MRSKRGKRFWVLAIWAGGIGCLASGTAMGQAWVSPGSTGPQRTRGTYGPRMSFGEFGYRLNYAEAFGGGIGGIGYGFGSRVYTTPGAGGTLVGNSAYITPGTGPGIAGYYPPWAVYGNSNQNPATFPPGSP